MAQDHEPRPDERLTDLGHLGSAVGHHVINAFSAVVSNAEILRLMAEAGSEFDPIAVADQIIRSALDASGVARRLIDYTRPITAVGDTPVSLHQLAAEVIEAEKALGPPGIAWAAELKAVPTIWGHDARLREMLRLLIANAREALPPSGGEITVATSQDDRGWVVLEVRDTGVGMPTDVQERAVEPFFTTKPGHMGVGLPIANGIWRRHRGTLALRSRPGEGTHVRLCVEPNPDRPL
jgi:signal transduction histidine kinase